AAAETSAATPLAWHVYESANFRVYHVDAEIALKASRAAEAVRSKQAKRWGSVATRSTWSPKCEIYLYPKPKDFAQMTGQPETSPGFSTMGVNGNRVIARRVNLRADHPQLLTAILPHEVTHVVLADLFTEKQIPRWADEGMAVLAEPVSEQLSRAGDLAAPLEQNGLFRLSELMAIDYPNAESWSLYYAQSVSLTQFLVGLASPEQFVAFVKMAQRQGVEQALRDVYQIEGFPDLETRWRNYARRQIATITASKGSSAGTAEGTRRE
ncbi:MAG: peptidase MA family metallohydrolase, partial [Isosphaeraceae bacterium]